MCLALTSRILCKPSCPPGLSAHQKEVEDKGEGLSSLSNTLPLPPAGAQWYGHHRAKKKRLRNIASLLLRQNGNRFHGISASERKAWGWSPGGLAQQLALLVFTSLSWAVEYSGSPSSPGVAFFKIFSTFLKFLSVHVDTIVVGIAVEGMGVEGGCDCRYFRI